MQRSFYSWSVLYLHIISFVIFLNIQRRIWGISDKEDVQLRNGDVNSSAMTNGNIDKMKNLSISKTFVNGLSECDVTSVKTNGVCNEDSGDETSLQQKPNGIHINGAKRTINGHV